MVPIPLWVYTARRIKRPAFVVKTGRGNCLDCPLRSRLGSGAEIARGRTPDAEEDFRKGAKNVRSPLQTP